MEIKEAQKIAAQKASPNYFTFYVDYCTKIVVPAKAGLMILEALTEAEIFTDSYGEVHGLKPMGSASQQYMACQTMGADEYRNLKMAQLLQIDCRDIKAKLNDEELIYTNGS